MTVSVLKQICGTGVLVGVQGILGNLLNLLIETEAASVQPDLNLPL